MKTFPTLYHKGKSGELRQWRTWADGDTMYTEHGVIDGALQISSKQCVGKNSGRSNETSPEEQAVAEATSAHKFKLERKYSLTPAEADLPLLLPMLAHVYDPKKHKGKYYVQPKLDGVRCIARWENDQVVLYSRQGKIYNVKHISDELATFMNKDDVFDGELYIHGMPLQSQISLVKKPQDNSTQVEYWIYDAPVIEGNDNVPFNKRFAYLLELWKKHNDPVKTWKKIAFTQTKYIGDNTNSIKTLQEKFISEGYEGLMLRGVDSEYLWGYRSSELLKVKTFQDAEFVVIGMKEGDGKMKGHAICICQNDLADNTFDAVPKTTMEERKYMYEHQDEFIGRKYTVKFFDRSLDLKPRFGVGLAFRDDV